MRNLFIIVTTFSICLSLSDTFKTSIGECHIYVEDFYQDLSLKSYVVEKTKSLVRQFGKVENKDFFIKIVNDPQLLYSDFPDWASGIAFRNKIIIDLSKSKNKSKIFQIVAHELCHVYQNRINKSYSFPAWFKEGMSMYFAKEFYVKGKGLRTNKSFFDYYINLQHLKNIAGMKNYNEVSSSYKQSLIAYSNIIINYGDQSINEIISQMNKGFLFDDAFENVIGISLYDFENQTNQKIKKSNKKSVFLRFPSFVIFIASITIFVVFIYIKKRNKKTIRRWQLEEELEATKQINESFDYPYKKN